MLNTRALLIYIGMQHSGIGGGGFMLVRGSDGKHESIGAKSNHVEFLLSMLTSQTSEKQRQLPLLKICTKAT